MSIYFTLTIVLNTYSGLSQKKPCLRENEPRLAVKVMRTTAALADFPF